MADKKTLFQITFDGALHTHDSKGRLRAPSVELPNIITVTGVKRFIFGWETRK